MPTYSYLSSSKYHKYAENWLLSLLQTRIHGPIDLSLSSWDGWHWSACHIIQMQYLTLSFSAEPIAFCFTAETHPLEHGLVWCNNHETTSHFQKVLLRTLSRFFLYFQRSPYISGQDPSTMSGFMSPHFPTGHFKLSMSCRSCWYPWK